MTTALGIGTMSQASSMRGADRLPFGKIVRTVSPLSFTALANPFSAACIPFGL